MKQKGFTLIELLVVIAIISLLTSASFASIQEPREKSRMAQGLVTTRALRDAAEIYFDDMGFYPPDVNRGWDPGFMQALPTNHATGATSNVCDDCPADWLTTLAARWHGPYVSSWTITSPWGGTYDYNNWSLPAVRYGCTVPAGVYIGIERDVLDNQPISAGIEQRLLDMHLDADECLNGEVEFLVGKL